jgi:hypothetical protein
MKKSPGLQTGASSLQRICRSLYPRAVNGATMLDYSSALLRCMTCAEDLRLRQAYEKALQAWDSSRSSLMRGVRSTETSSARRRQILAARLKAANDLYEHSLKCADCKMSKVGLFQDKWRGPANSPYRLTPGAGRREPSSPSRSPSTRKPNSTQEPISLQLSTISIKKRPDHL